MKTEDTSLECRKVGTYNQMTFFLSIGFPEDLSMTYDPKNCRFLWNIKLPWMNHNALYDQFEIQNGLPLDEKLNSTGLCFYFNKIN